MSIKNKTKLSLKKGLTVITSAATILVLSGVALVPSGAQAQTTAEIIAQLQAQIVALTAQLNALVAGQPAPSTACTFTRSLFLGVVGNDVMCLQQYLNSTANKVAATGAGSPGSETTYYGSRTQSAVASWQAANGVSPAAGYFGPISQAKYSSMAVAPGVPGATPAPGVPGNVVASLAPDNPGAKTVMINSYGVVLMSVRFTGSGKVQELTFKRNGPGDVADYDNLYIYDGARRLVSGRTPSSATGEVTFISLGIDVSGSKDLQLVADHSGVASNVNRWELTSAKLASGAVSGTPLMSNNFTIGGSNGGTINVDKTGSIGGPKVGQKAAQVSEFKITANTEAAWVRRVQLIQGGTVKNADLTNLKLEVNAVQVATGYMTSDGYAVFDFGSPGYKIDKGDNKIFKMYADLAGKKDETIKYYVEVASDVTAIGDQFGFGMKPTVDTNFDDSSNTHSLTLQGGVLTIAFNGPNATNVGTKVSDQILYRFSMSAANDIEVKKLRLGFCHDPAGDGTFASISNDFDDVTDVKVIDEDTGQVVAGPTDGTGFTEAAADGCEDRADGTYKTYTDTFDLKAGTTRNFKVTADIDTGANTTNNELAATDVINVMLDGYGESDLSGTSGDVAVLKYAGTNTAVDDSDIVPNTDLIGKNMTLQASTLTLSLSSSPADTTYVKGTQTVDTVGITFAASLASSLKVTDITLTGYVDDDGTAPFTKGIGSNSDSSLTTSGLVSKVSLYDGDNGLMISDVVQTNNLNNSTGTIKFANLSWMIDAGKTKKLLVKTNLSSNPTSGSNDYFMFDIDATTDVTALDSSNQTVNAGNADPNGATAPTNVVTVSSAGTLALSLASSNPIKKAVYWGQNDSLFTVYRVRSTDEAFLIERLNIVTATGSSEAVASATNNVDQVKMKYKTKAQLNTSLTTTAVGTLDSTTGSVSFAFTGDDRPYVPKDSSTDVELYANIRPKAGRTGTALSTLGSEVEFSLDWSNGKDDEFRAVGEGSGTVLTNADITDSQKTKGTDHRVYRVFPEFVQESLPAGSPVGTKDILKFTIKAHGLADSRILFDDRPSAAIRFEVLASGAQSATDMTARLYDALTGEQYASATLAAGQTSLVGARASITFSEWDKDVEIAGGSQKTFRVQLAFTGFTDKNDTLQIVLRDTDVNVVFRYVDGA
ncbi:MAG: putative Ca2+-binding protein [Parcubacteria group bacterium Gr01-1014_2]|nr:MAG: putative Ca2+-binding protein [Parcubacteria group bacterium Gr01-1014_2]